MWQEETVLCQAMTIHLQIDVKVGAYTKFQNPTTTPSGRLSKEPRREEEREKITQLITAITLAPLVHALRSDQFIHRIARNSFIILNTILSLYSVSNMNKILNFLIKSERSQYSKYIHLSIRPDLGRQGKDTRWSQKLLSRKMFIQIQDHLNWSFLFPRFPSFFMLKVMSLMM